MSAKKLRVGQEQEVIRLYEEGRTEKEIAAMFGCSTGPVSRALTVGGIERRTNADYEVRSGRRRFTEDQDMEISDRYREGLSIKAIAREHECSPAAIYTALIRTGTGRRNGHPSARFTPEQDVIVAREYESGVSLEILGGKYKCSPAAIRNVLKRTNTPRRPAGPRFHEWTEEQIADMVALHKEGQSQGKIAKRHSTSAATVSRILEESGRDTSHRSGPNHGLWKGGRHYTPQGYVHVRIYANDPLADMRFSNGYVAEHRLVMARHLGRALSRGESVHHINGVKDDNRIENLELRQGQHGKNQAFRCADCGSCNVVPVSLGSI